MSADNGIYIGVFPKASNQEEKEYRVISAQAIDNCDDSDNFPQELTDLYRTTYYNNTSVHIFSNEDDAWKFAGKLYNREIEEDGFVEYGVCKIEYNRPLISLAANEANKKIDNWWKQRGKNALKEIYEEAQKYNLDD